MKRSEKMRLALERNTIVYKLPEDWRIREDALTAPRGYIWIYNGYSRFCPLYEVALLKL